MSKVAGFAFIVAGLGVGVFAIAPSDDMGQQPEVAQSLMSGHVASGAETPAGPPGSSTSPCMQPTPRALERTERSASLPLQGHAECGCVQYPYHYRVAALGRPCGDPCSSSGTIAGHSATTTTPVPR